MNGFESEHFTFSQQLTCSIEMKFGKYSPAAGKVAPRLNGIDECVSGSIGALFLIFPPHRSLFSQTGHSPYWRAW